MAANSTLPCIHLIRLNWGYLKGHGYELVIPRNGNDSQGGPYVVVMCTECLRTFQLPVVEETAGAIVETPCRFCPNKNRYIIEPLGIETRQLFA